MDVGRFDIPMRFDTPPGVLQKIRNWGIIYITPQYAGRPERWAEDIPKWARYAGVVRGRGRIKREDGTDQIFIRGGSLNMFLGDQSDIGDILAAEITFAVATDTIDDALDNLLPGTLTKGTVDTTGTDNVDGAYQWVTPLFALRKTFAIARAEYRVNPDGTVDGALDSNLFNIDDADVIAVVSATHRGSDVQWKSLPIIALDDARHTDEEVFRMWIVDPASPATAVAVFSKDVKLRTAPNGILIQRERVIFDSDPPGATGGQTLIQHMLDASGEAVEMRITTSYWEVASGSLRVGDNFWIWDPPHIMNLGTVDPDSGGDETDEFPIIYQGEWIFPRKARLQAATWPVVERMGVYYRPPRTAATVAASDPYIDLSPWIDPEPERAELFLRGDVDVVAGASG